jgi:tRNA 2-thiouridine synthesizing protein A
MSETTGLPLVVDARGLKCPLPVLHAKKALQRLASGQTLEVLCTDPVSVIDIPNLVREMGFRVEHSEQKGSDYRFVIVFAEESP